MTLTKGTLSMTERTLTAMYDTRGAAKSARDGLVALGIPADAIAIRGTEDDRDTTTADEDQGFWASLANLFVPDEDRHIYAEGVRRGGYLLTAQVPESTAEQAREVLERSDPVDIDERAASWRQSGWTGYEADKPSYAGASATAAYSEGAGLAETDPAFAPATTPVSTARQASAGVSLAPAAASGGTVPDIGHEDVVQAAEEELQVGKRDVGRGSVRVRSYVTERPVEEQIELRQERVTIERRPVDRAVEPGDAAFTERTIEAVERGEEAVVSKTARVTEEIGLRKDVEQETKTIRDTVRKQEVEVEDDRSARRLTDTPETTTRD